MVQMSTANVGIQQLLESMTKDLNMSPEQIQTELQEWIKNREKFQAWKQREEMEQRRVQLLQQQIDRSVEIVRADRENRQPPRDGRRTAQSQRSNGQQKYSQTQATAYPLISTRKQAQRQAQQHQQHGALQKLSVSTLQKLQREFDKETAMMNDDVQFINEVVTGQEVAEDMNPLLELVNLKKQFDVWKEEYKVKLRKAREVIHVNQQNTKTPQIEVAQPQAVGRSYNRSLTPQSTRSGSLENKRKFTGFFRSKS